MDAIDACYYFAGVVGMPPERRTLRQLWRLAAGRIKQRRFEMLEQAILVWSAGDIDAEKYLHFGQLVQTGKGGPVKMSPILAAKVDAEVERLRNENPNVPKVTLG